jgi:fluoride exporter
VLRDISTGPALAAVALGAVLGAWLRYGLALALNPRWSALPLGTLTANLIGGYLVGIAIAVVAANPAFSPFWRLLVITGFLGGLTTFSTFSAESVALLSSAQWSKCAAAYGGSSCRVVGGHRAGHCHFSGIFLGCAAGTTSNGCVQSKAKV